MQRIVLSEIEGQHMAKKRKARKTKPERKRTSKRNNPKKRSPRKLHVVAKRKNEGAEIPRALTPHDIFQGINGRRPNSDEELNEWLASPEGKAAMTFEQTSLDRWGETGRS